MDVPSRGTVVVNDLNRNEKLKSGVDRFVVDSFAAFRLQFLPWVQECADNLQRRDPAAPLSAFCFSPIPHG